MAAWTWWPLSASDQSFSGASALSRLPLGAGFACAFSHTSPLGKEVPIVNLLRGRGLRSWLGLTWSGRHYFRAIIFSFPLLSYLQVLFVMLFRAVGMASVACGCRW